MNSGDVRDTLVFGHHDAYGPDNDALESGEIDVLFGNISAYKNGGIGKDDTKDTE